VIDLKHERTGKLAPIDSLPVVHGGNVIVNLEAGTYRLVSKAERLARMGQENPEQLYLSHFFTCPDRDYWRLRRPLRVKTHVQVTLD
jgi:hypothetical protein